MSAWGERARPFSILFAALSACNGQFDFDTAPLDAGEPTLGETGPSDVASTGDISIDVPLIGRRIACGASDCLSSGCCSTASGTRCIDVAEGGICGGLLIQCDDTEDCPVGQVCCAEGDVRARARASVSDGANGAPPDRVHCEPESHCRAMGFVILCNPYRPHPCSQCIATTLTGLPPGYHQCAAML
jgi:hypothetical protein